MATLLRLTPAVIGLTVVAAGTSVPELAVSAVAGLRGRPDITVGNVVGSNIFNVTFIIGLRPSSGRCHSTGNTIRLEYPVLVLVTLALPGRLRARDRQPSRRGVVPRRLRRHSPPTWSAWSEQQVTAGEAASACARRPRSCATVAGPPSPRGGWPYSLLAAGVVLLAGGVDVDGHAARSTSGGGSGCPSG